MKKVKAFTLIELTVALVISALVVSFALLIYRQVNQSFDIFKRSANEQIGVVQFQEILRQDIEKSDSIILNKPKGIILLNRTVGFDQDKNVTRVKYNWSKKRVMRQAQNFAKDSFDMEIKKVTVSLLGKKAEGQNQLIDQLDMEIEEGKKLKFIFTKQYAAKDLIKL